MNSEENEMKRYSDSEIDRLIDELTAAAEEAIERAAAEAAQATALALVEREATALQEARHWRQEAEALKKAGIKNVLITGLVCFFGGLVAGGMIFGSGK